MEMKLTQEQKAKIRDFIESYKRWMETEEGKENYKVHQEHHLFFSKKLARDNIRTLTEEDFREIYKNLWASNLWGNKDWFFDNRLLRPNGLSVLKEELYNLLYGKDNIVNRLDNFREKVSGFGTSSISEILHFVFPDKYCLWNDKPKTALPYLEIDLLPKKYYKYQLKTGSEYVECIEVLALFKEELKENGFKNPDFITVDCLLWHIWNKIEGKDRIKKELYEEEEVQEIIEELDFSSFISSINTETIKHQPHLLKSPERIKIRDIITSVEKDWTLPHFQRYFDWDKEDIREFLESIFNDYFVGSFLLWDLEKEPPVDVISIKGFDDKIERPDSIILDGQQRITSLYYSIKAPNLEIWRDKDEWDDTKFRERHQYFYIDLRAFFENDPLKDIVICKDTRYTFEDTYKQLLFPFYHLENYRKWLNDFEKFLLTKSNDTNKIIEIRHLIDDKLNHILNGFEIPIIQLPKSFSIEQVADIFENINTRGERLDTFDLLIARLYKYKINLRELWGDYTVEKYKTIDRYAKKSEKVRLYIFQAISLCYHPASSCKRRDILDIYENIYQKHPDLLFKEHWEEFSNYVDLAIQKLENLKDGFGVKDEKEMPFLPVIPIIASLLREIDSRHNKFECNKKLEMWYWSSVFTNAYSSSVDSRLTADFKELKDWFDDDSKVPKSVQQAKINLQVLRLRNLNTQSNAMYKGVMSLLALEGSKDFETGKMLGNARENDKDHIFPKSRKYDADSSKYIDSVLNMAWLSKKTNIRKSNKEPKEYIKDFIEEVYKENENEFLDILETHFINKKAYGFLINNELVNFVKERENLVLSKIGELIGAKSDIEVQFDKSEMDVINKFEVKLRDFVNYNMKNKYGSNWWKVIPDNVKAVVQERTEKEIKSNPTFDINQYKDEQKLLRKTDLEHLRQIITSQWRAVFGESFKGTPEDFTFHFRNILNLRNSYFHSNEPESEIRNLGLGSLERMNKVLLSKKWTQNSSRTTRQRRVA
ncbi:DUF262 domain-containing protein [Candidatus Woesearchaeota archaeon]|nr:DUF262 domain-containing protein [Candidatus Woesearchaeota archaeon]